MGAKVLSVNVGRAITVEWSPDQQPTAIDKRPVVGAVPIRLDRVGTDEHGSPGHGGPHAVVYAYAREDAEFWEAEIGRELTPGAFGENLTTTGLAVSGAVTGERWRGGTGVLPAATPRVPRRPVAAPWAVPGPGHRVAAGGRPAGGL